MNIQLIGIPSNAGALNLGTESGPDLLRQAGLIKALSQVHDVKDLGDVKLPLNMVRHNTPPIRNWPSPRLVWEETIRQLSGKFTEEALTLIIGGGCSVFTGIFHSFHEKYKEGARIISIDHHIDIKEPSPDICMGATAFTHWFLTEDNQWFKKPEGFNKEKIIALAYEESAVTDDYNIDGIHAYSKSVMNEKGVDSVLSACLSKVGHKERVIVHLDLDVIDSKDLSSVYMPSSDGMPLETVTKILKDLMNDSRVRALVVTEFSGAYDHSDKDALVVVDLLTQALSGKGN